MECMSRRRLLLVAVTTIALVAVSPVLIGVYSELGDTLSLSPWWLLAVVGAVTVQMTASIELQRIVLRTAKRLDVGAPFLAGNAVSHLAPGGNAVGAGVQLRMLTIAGFSATQAVTALGAIAMINVVSGLVVLPMIVLVASAAGSSIDPSLVAAMWTGAAVLVVVLATILTIARHDGPWRLIARAAARVQRSFGRNAEADVLARHLVSERDLVRATLRGRAARVLMIDLCRALGDFGALYCALRAVGAPVNPAAALAAFIVSNLAGMIPLTPGGLGFVEAGLAGVLIVAGASTTDANLTVATYRLAATWLPCLGGAVALVWFQRRHRERGLTELLTQPVRSPDSDAHPGTPPSAVSNTGNASPPPPDP